MTHSNDNDDGALHYLEVDKPCGHTAPLPPKPEHLSYDPNTKMVCGLVDNAGYALCSPSAGLTAVGCIQLHRTVHKGIFLTFWISVIAGQGEVKLGAGRAGQLAREVPLRVSRSR